MTSRRMVNICTFGGVCMHMYFLCILISPTKNPTRPAPRRTLNLSPRRKTQFLCQTVDQLHENGRTGQLYPGVSPHCWIFICIGIGLPSPPAAKIVCDIHAEGPPRRDTRNLKSEGGGGGRMWMMVVRRRRAGLFIAHVLRCSRTSVPPVTWEGLRAIDSEDCAAEETNRNRRSPGPAGFTSSLHLLVPYLLYRIRQGYPAL